ncbi:MAG TPA: hypothetical protein PLS01_04815, partial [Clostridia bacterium]|nr:hypothetical protein [Clostridia bacterium]
MKKQQFLVLALAFMLLGAALLVATVAASHTFSNVLLISAREKQALLEKAEDAPAWRTMLFRNNYPLLLLGLVFFGAGLYFLRGFNHLSERGARFSKLMLTEYRPLVILLFATLVFTALSARFFTVSNFTNILKQISHYAILAAGVYFAILLGGI